MIELQDDPLPQSCFQQEIPTSTSPETGQTERVEESKPETIQDEDFEALDLDLLQTDLDDMTGLPVPP